MSEHRRYAIHRRSDSFLHDVRPTREDFEAASSHSCLVHGRGMADLVRSWYRNRMRVVELVPYGTLVSTDLGILPVYIGDVGLAVSGGPCSATRCISVVPRISCPCVGSPSIHYEINFISSGVFWHKLEGPRFSNSYVAHQVRKTEGPLHSRKHFVSILDVRFVFPRTSGSYFSRP